MSAAELQERPAFRSVDESFEHEGRRISRLAVVVFLIGLLSLLSLLSNIFLPLAALAIVLGIISIIRTLKDSTLSGSIFAQLGLGLGIISIICTVTFTKARDSYLYSVAGDFAETFLAYLTDDEKYYDALELLRSEQDRQITGTDLKAYYENAREGVSGSLDSFLSEPGTQAILASKGSADWLFQRGIRTWGTEDSRYVEVEMRNAAQESSQAVRITLQRITGLLVDDEGEPTAHWNVYDVGLSE